MSSAPQCALSRGSDRNEEGCWGQRDAAVPPPVPAVKWTDAGHRVDSAETQLQTTRGNSITLFLLHYLFIPHRC